MEQTYTLLEITSSILGLTSFALSLIVLQKYFWAAPMWFRLGFSLIPISSAWGFLCTLSHCVYVHFGWPGTLLDVGLCTLLVAMLSGKFSAKILKPKWLKGDRRNCTRRVSDNFAVKEDK